MSFWGIYLLLALVTSIAIAIFCSRYSNINVLDSLFPLFAGLLWPLTWFAIIILIVAIWIIDVIEDCFSRTVGKDRENNRYE